AQPARGAYVSGAEFFQRRQVLQRQPGAEAVLVGGRADAEDALADAPPLLAPLTERPSADHPDRHPRRRAEHDRRLDRPQDPQERPPDQVVAGADAEGADAV